MVEELTHLEALLVPEYWRGHGIEDSCHWKTRGEFLDEVGDIRTFRRRLGEADEFAREVLGVYRARPKGVAIRRFIEGQSFDGADFPAGTLVRFETDSLSRERKPLRNWSKSKRTKKIMLGVVTDVIQPQTNQRILSAIRERYLLKFSGRTPLLSIGRSSLIDVGEVDHERRIEGGEALGGLHVIESLRERSESISRVSWVDVLQFREATVGHDVLTQLQL